jgi:SAM-dependent methyltransferase
MALVYARWWRPVAFGLATGFRMPSLNEEADLVVRRIEGSPGPWLDLSCGPGNMTQRLLAAAGEREVFALDRSEPMLDRVRVNAPRARRVCADAARLPFADCTFGAVVNLAALDLYPDPARVVAESARVLAPGGRWVASSLMVDSASHAKRGVRTRIWQAAAGSRTPSEAEVALFVRKAGLSGLDCLRFGRYVIAWADKSRESEQDTGP